METLDILQTISLISLYMHYEYMRFFLVLQIRILYKTTQLHAHIRTKTENFAQEYGSNLRRAVEDQGCNSQEF